MYCTKCGAQCSDDSLYCPKCGANLTMQNANDAKITGMDLRPTKPSSYLIGSILVMLFCFLPTGLVALIYSISVDNLYGYGKYDEAMRASKNAKNWIIASIVIMVAAWILVLIFVFVVGFAAVGMGLDEELYTHIPSIATVG